MRVVTCGLTLVAAVLCGCTVQKTQPLVPGVGLTIDGGAVAIDPGEVPLVSGACADGQVVIRSGDGWACAAATTGPTGPTGTPGTPCATSRLDAIEARLLALETAQCPRGFTYSLAGSYIVCSRTFLGDSDVMVKVGDFWIDRYEVSVCSGGSQNLGHASGSGYGTEAAACSTPGVTPKGMITWFQAAQMCANAGKTLCTNAEWQTAASGTPDPGSWPTASGSCTGAASPTACNTCAGGPGTAGHAVDCVSRFGAYDMIGNFLEWVADWYVGGRTAAAPYSDTTVATPWPSGYSTDGADVTSDVTSGVDGRAQYGGGYHDGTPAAGLRGGHWYLGTQAGAFCFGLNSSPAYVELSLGTRCCLRGQ